MYAVNLLQEIFFIIKSKEHDVPLQFTADSLRNIRDTLVGHGLNKFAKLLTNTELEYNLKERGAYTVFAPIDEAFDDLTHDQQLVRYIYLTPLSNDKVFGLYQIQGRCRQQFKCSSRMIFVTDRVENILGKGENVCN